MPTCVEMRKGPAALEHVASDSSKSCGTLLAFRRSMSAIDFSRLRDRVLELHPAFTAQDAERATIATLRGLAEQFDAEHLEQLQRELPPALARACEGVRRHSSRPSQHGLFESVANDAQVSLDVAIEHSEVICRALGEQLPQETLSWIRSGYPQLADLFHVPGDSGSTK